MKLLRVHVVSAQTCGGLLDGLDLHLREPMDDLDSFDPICLVGPNGSGKSQFLQLLAELMQSICHAVAPSEERIDGNTETLFEVEYVIYAALRGGSLHIRASRLKEGRGKPKITLAVRNGDDWEDCPLDKPLAREIIPQRVVGYSSGDNETLSLPFLVSRSGYADEVGTRALDKATQDQEIPDTRLMLIDYGTNLEVLVANLLAGTEEQRSSLLVDSNVDNIHSLRCIIQLAHPSHPKAPRSASTHRKGIQLTSELEYYLQHLKACSTCYHHDEKTDTHTFDYWVSPATREAFSFYWDSAIALYKALHKLAMLNDLAIPKPTRVRFRRETKSRKFASRLPEPQDEEKVFRFEQVKFAARAKGQVDYVSLSDGEHQLGQLLGTLLMQATPGVLFLLDEPESHFNPQWRVKCISRILSLPTDNGARNDSNSSASDQECILTTHAPFVPCDIPRERVFIFAKDGKGVTVRRPNIETYGTAFDTLLEECFGVAPPISKRSRDDSLRASESNNVEELERTIAQMGDSVQRAILIDQLLRLKDEADS